MWWETWLSPFYQLSTTKIAFQAPPPPSFSFHIPLSNFEFATLPTSNKLLTLFASLSPSLPQFFNRDESRTLIFFFSQVIRDEHLFLIVGAIVLLDILLLSLWSGIEPMHTGYQRFIDEVWYCSSTMRGNCSRSEGANDSEIISLCTLWIFVSLNFSYKLSALELLWWIGSREKCEKEMKKRNKRKKKRNEIVLN